MEKENSSMDISVGEKVVQEPTIDNNEVSSKLKDVNVENSEAVDDNDDDAEPSAEQKGGNERKF